MSKLIYELERQKRVVLKMMQMHLQTQGRIFVPLLKANPSRVTLRSRTYIYVIKLDIHILSLLPLLSRVVSYPPEPQSLDAAILTSLEREEDKNRNLQNL